MFKLILEIEEAHGKKFSWPTFTRKMASNVPKPSTLKKWTTEFKWLEIRDNRMYCRICTKWQKKLASCRNYSDAFITKGSNNWQRSAVNDHNMSAMHSDANDHENRETLGDQFRKHVVHIIPDGNPLKQCFARMSENERQMLVRSFEVAYHLAKKGRPYSDFAELIELEKMHGVKFLSSYGHRNACKQFIHFISETIFNENVKNKLLHANFVSVLCDGSTDSSIVEKELIYVIFVDPETFVPTCSFFALKEPISQDAAGIKQAIEESFREKGLSDILAKMVFLSSHGTATNSGLVSGLITLFKRDMPWVAFVWCFSHRLELALKDALSSEFELVEESLRHLFYMYKNSSKKVRELKVLYQALQNVYEFVNNQIRPAKSGGTRWIDHKLQACSQIVDKLGVYVQHIENIIADTSKKASDRDALTGEVRKLKCASLVLRSALFIDLLDNARKFSVISQKAEVNILLMIDTLDDTLLHYQMLLMKLKKDPAFVFELPTLKSVLSRIEGDTYQGVKLTNLKQAKESISRNVYKMVQEILVCLQERYGVLTADTEEEKTEMEELVTKEVKDGDSLLHDVCKVLRTSAWLHSCDEPLTCEQLCLKFSTQISSIERVYERFKPLFSNHVNTLKLSLVKYVHDCMGNAAANAMDPIEMWQTLKKIKGESFPEIFLVIEICLCSPFSNATLERFFSHMGVVKTDWRNRLNEQSLEDNLRIHVAGPDLTRFSETYVAKAVAAWYNDKPRRMNQKKRKKYKQKATASKKSNVDLGLDLSDICQCDKTGIDCSGGEASNGSESGSSSDTD